MQIKAYLEEKGFTDAAFAELIGVDRSTVTRMRKNGQTPGAETMRRIAEVTNGAVTANDFFGIAA
jgi:transcriptional regulator with XRE-family HTH domain